MKVVVVSPHLDDAVLSVGATMNSLVRRGIEVALVTISPATSSSRGSPGLGRGPRGSRQAGGAGRPPPRGCGRGLRARCATVLAAERRQRLCVARREPETIWAALSGTSLGLPPCWCPAARPTPTTASRPNLVVGRAPSDLPVLFYTEMPYGAHPVAAAKGLLTGRRSAALAHAIGGPATWACPPSVATPLSDT